jgi:hypothetical protein
MHPLTNQDFIDKGIKALFEEFGITFPPAANSVYDINWFYTRSNQNQQVSAVTKGGGVVYQVIG